MSNIETRDQRMYRYLRQSQPHPEPGVNAYDRRAVVRLDVIQWAVEKLRPSVSPVTVLEFVAACVRFKDSEITDLFERTELSSDLRTEILSFGDKDSTDPVRSALRSLGKKYEVLSLCHY